MNTSAAMLPERRPTLLFVDDEQRVLNSMRALFRRQYDVLVAASGPQALDILGTGTVDVVISDQRMSAMTGVEFLSEVKRQSPETTRILLTGYADVQVIEASINESEVFRYLMKPCSPDELRAAVREALTTETVETPPLPARLAEMRILDAPPNRHEEHQEEREEQEDTAVTHEHALAAIQKRQRADPNVEIMVLTTDKGFLRAIENAVQGAFPVVSVRSIASASSVLANASSVIASSNVGVLVTDSVANEVEVESLTRKLRVHVPNLVLVVASDRSDASTLIGLINHGQVFRFLVKPVQGGQCRIWLSSAVNEYLATSDAIVETHAEPSVSLGARLAGWFNSLRRHA